MKIEDHIIDMNDNIDYTFLRHKNLLSRVLEEINEELLNVDR